MAPQLQPVLWEHQATPCCSSMALMEQVGMDLAELPIWKGERTGMAETRLYCEMPSGQASCLSSVHPIWVLEA